MVVWEEERTLRSDSPGTPVSTAWPPRSAATSGAKEDSLNSAGVQQSRLWPGLPAIALLRAPPGPSINATNRQSSCHCAHRLRAKPCPCLSPISPAPRRHGGCCQVTSSPAHCRGHWWLFTQCAEEGRPTSPLKTTAATAQAPGTAFCKAQSSSPKPQAGQQLQQAQ